MGKGGEGQRLEEAEYAIATDLEAGTARDYSS